MSLDQYGDVLATTDPGHVVAWPTTQRITTRQWLTAHLAHLLGLKAPRPGGRHRNDRARRPVPAGYLLTPAAQQLTTGTREQIPAGPDEETGLLTRRAIRTTGAWTVPAGVATDDEIQQWVIDDQTTGQVTA